MHWTTREVSTGSRANGLSKLRALNVNDLAPFSLALCLYELVSYLKLFSC